MKTLTIGDLKARIPIIQGGMGVGISLSGLASAVANEVGLALSPPPVSVSYIRNFLPTTPKPAIWALQPRSGKPARRPKALSA